MSFLNVFCHTLYGSRPYKRWTTPAEIAVTAFGLGVFACLGLMLIVLYLRDVLGIWGLSMGCYMVLVHSWFHISEFVVAAQYRPHDSTPESFLLFHSKAYLIAQAAAWSEFVIEAFLIPDEWKYAVWLTPTTIFFGCVGVIFFYGIRVVAMIQCGSNFALQIEYKKRVDHKLVSTGLYKYLRHPSYFGWFYHAMCTQVIFANPICFVGFTLVTWGFFKDRIPHEEEELASEKFFGKDYDEFKKKTIVGIPFIR